MRLGAPIAVLAAALLIGGCGRDEAPPDRKGDASGLGERAGLGVGGNRKEAAQDLGFPTFATKNTTRVGGTDAVATAAAIARAVYPGTAATARPQAVTLVDKADWRTALVASALMAQPLGAPILFADGAGLPDASSSALEALAPTGAEKAGDAQVIRIGDVAKPEGLKSTDVTGANPFARARAIARLLSAAVGRTSDRVLVVSADSPSFAAPAAGLAAKSGDPVLLVNRDRVPADTRAALVAMQQPKIYVLGPSTVISPDVRKTLSTLGKVTRFGGATPVANAIEAARFREGSFGWGVVDPGHGLVFARANDPLYAAAAAPLSATGTYGPLLLLDDAGRLPRPLEQYLLDIQPGYAEDPVRGVYNHGWIVGDADSVSVAVQSRIDSLLEIVPVRTPADVSNLPG